MRHSIGLQAILVCAATFIACGGTDPGDGAAPLGTKQLAGYRIDVTPSLALSSAGFGVTATGGGHFRLLWIGAQADLLEGTLTTDGQFDPTGTSPLGGKELVANQAGMIQFRLNPTAQVNGLDLVTSSGPIYLDLTRNADRAAASISFLREGRTQRSAHNPVAIDVR